MKNICTDERTEKIVFCFVFNSKLTIFQRISFHPAMLLFFLSQLKLKHMSSTEEIVISLLHLINNVDKHVVV